MSTPPPPDGPEHGAVDDGPGVAGEAEWRLEVGRTRAAHLRKALPFTVNVGWPTAGRVTAGFPWPVPREYDAGLRFDALDALVEHWEETETGRERRAHGWLTRTGVPSIHDQDLLWYAAAAHVCSARQIELLSFRAVTHTGWLDVVTGEQRVWRRLRV